MLKNSKCDGEKESQEGDKECGWGSRWVAVLNVVIGMASLRL